MIKIEELESIQIGNILRNIHTGDCHPLDKIDVVSTYNPATKQKDLQINVYVIATNRWNTKLLRENWELVGDAGECADIDFLYGVDYQVDSPTQGTWRDKEINDTLKNMRDEGVEEE